MEAGAQIQQALIERAAGYVILVWIVAAICAGLIASETKKRRFWTYLKRMDDGRQAILLDQRTARWRAGGSRTRRGGPAAGRRGSGSGGRGC